MLRFGQEVSVLLDHVFRLSIESRGVWWEKGRCNERHTMTISRTDSISSFMILKYFNPSSNTFLPRNTAYSNSQKIYNVRNLTLVKLRKTQPTK